MNKLLETKEPTLEDMLIASFYEHGRWICYSKDGNYEDTKTGLKIFYTLFSLFVDDRIVSDDVMIHWLRAQEQYNKSLKEKRDAELFNKFKKFYVETK